MISAQNTNIHIMGRKIAALITAKQVTQNKVSGKISGMLLTKKVYNNFI